jgi:hypothetical protein
LRGKGTGGEADRSNVYGAEVENDWRYTSTPVYASWRGKVQLEFTWLPRASRLIILPADILLQLLTL